MLEDDGVVAADRPLVSVGWRVRPGRNGPADGLAYVVDARGMIRSEGELLSRRNTLAPSQDSIAANANRRRIRMMRAYLSVTV